MRSDSDIKRDVEEELRWDANINATDIGVTAKGGVVALSGFVRSYNEKWQAERDAKRIVGVVGVADDIEVRLPTSFEKTDPELVRDAASVLSMQLPYLADSIQVIATNGWLTLEGTVDWQHQKQRAEEVIRGIRGIKHLVNAIHVKPEVSIADVKHRIEDAFRRNAEIDAGTVAVQVDGSLVFLHGMVRTWAEREEAERAAWLAPGVTKVQNRIMIRP